MNNTDAHMDDHIDRQTDSQVAPVPLPPDVDHNRPEDGNKKPKEKEPEGVQDKRILYGVIGGGVVVILIMVVVGVLLYIAPYEPHDVTARLRDIAVILLALESIIIALVLIVLTVAVVYLVIKVYELTDMVQNIVIPLLEDVKAKSTNTINTVQGTTNFVSEKVVEPVITIGGHIGAIRRVLRMLVRK